MGVWGVFGGWGPQQHGRPSKERDLRRFEKVPRPKLWKGMQALPLSFTLHIPGGPRVPWFILITFKNSRPGFNVGFAYSAWRTARGWGSVQRRRWMCQSRVKSRHQCFCFFSPLQPSRRLQWVLLSGNVLVWPWKENNLFSTLQLFRLENISCGVSPSHAHFFISCNTFMYDLGGIIHYYTGGPGKI